MMLQRKLGKDLTVSALGLGCMGMSEFYGPADEQDSIRTIHRAVDLGVTLFDTADIYGKGENEKLVGKALAPHCDRVVIATKFGIVRDDPSRSYNGSPDYVRRSCEASLRRLDTEVIDLYYLHRLDPDVPIEDTVGAMADLVRVGMVRHIGLSEVSSKILWRANLVHPIAALQTEYSLWQRDVEEDILKTCEELEIGFVPYSPLGRGLLTGSIKSINDLAPDDWRRSVPRFQGDNLDANLALASAVRDLAERKQVTPAQIALSWVLGKSKTIVPIPGTRRISRLEENLASLEIVLSDEDRAFLEARLPVGAAKGARYPV
jgi:aryl-alcohol dehydrogenase-like predicted oxidoreductase